MARQITKGFELLPIPSHPTRLLHLVRTTINDYAAKNGMTYLQAAGLFKFLEQKRIARKVDKARKVVGGRGKPSDVYELPSQITLNIAA